MNIFKDIHYFPISGGIHNWIDNIKLFFRKIKWAYQRVTKGYSDYDLWDLDVFYSDILSHSLKEFSEKTHGYPGHDQYTTYDSWVDDLVKISEQIRCSEEDNDEYFKNRYQTEYDALLFDSIFTDKERSPEEQELCNKYYAEEKRIAEQKHTMRKEALVWIADHFEELWD